eukprot:g4722.t1
MLSAPSSKRVRWDDSVPADVPQAVQTAESAPPPVPPKAEVRSCQANDAIRLSSVGENGDANREEGSHEDGFRPDFTHQLFEEERIEGFEEGELTIRVLYTPTSLDFLVKIQTDDSDDARVGDVMSRLSKALPPDNYTTDEPSFYQQLETRQRGFNPPGARVHGYNRGQKTFSVYRATGEDPGACEYHERAQCLAPWFIEAADNIDLTDDRWEVFYLFQDEGGPATRQVLGEKWRPAALAGYFTVFGFRNPVKGVSLRICQALTLPQFQRQGHGQALLAFLYGLARSRESVFEVTVEDPAPGFEKMRNLVDARTLWELGAFPTDALAPNEFKRPSKDVVQAARDASKLTFFQVDIGFDILKARDVPVDAGGADEADAGSAISAAVGPPSNSTSAATSGGISRASASGEHTTAAATSAAKAGASKSPSPGDGHKEAETVDDKRKRYRLMVKRRLLKRHGEELATDATTRKRQLEELYREVEADLLGAGAKLRKEMEVKRESHSVTEA